MAKDDLCWMPAADLAAGIARRRFSPIEVVDAVLARIEKLERLNAYVIGPGADEMMQGFAEVIDRVNAHRDERFDELRELLKVKDRVERI